MCVLKENTENLYIFYLVPVVTLLVEGGKESINTIYYDLKANIPVVVIDVR